MDQSFTHHPLADSRLLEQFDSRPLEEPSADASLDVIARVPLEHDAFHSRAVQELREQQP
jgi:hypothetical protein